MKQYLETPARSLLHHAAKSTQSIMSTLATELPWYESTCADYSISSSGYTAAAAVSSYFGASDSNFARPLQRMSPLMSFLNKFLAACGDVTDSTACDPFITNVASDTDLNAYVNSLTGTQSAGFALAAIVGVVIIPLYIARCLPARCCKPQKGPHTDKQRAAAAGCCSFWWLLVFALTLVAISSGAAASSGIYFSICGTISLVADVRNFTQGIHAEVVTTHAALNATSNAFTDLKASLDVMGVTMGPSGGVVTSCTAISDSLATIASLDADVFTATNSSALATNADLSTANTALQGAQTALCTARVNMQTNAPCNPLLRRRFICAHPRAAAAIAHAVPRRIGAPMYPPLHPPMRALLCGEPETDRRVVCRPHRPTSTIRSRRQAQRSTLSRLPPTLPPAAWHCSPRCCRAQSRPSRTS